MLLAPVWPMLRVLDLSFVNLEAALISVQVANLCPKLEGLSVSHCEAVDDATIVALAHGKCAGSSSVHFPILSSYDSKSMGIQTCEFMTAVGINFLK